MSTIAENLADPELLETEWDLEPLVYGQGLAGVEPMLEQAVDRATKFAQAYAGRIAELDAEQLQDAMRELGELEDLLGRAGSYAALRFSTDTADRGRLIAGNACRRVRRVAPE